MKIRTRIIVSYTSVVLILVAICVCAICFYIYTVLRSQANDHLTTINHLKSEAVDSYFDGKTDFITNMAASSVFRDYLKTASTSADFRAQKTKSEDRLDRTKATYQNPDLNELFLVNSQGIIVASTDKTQEGQDKKSDTYFIEGQKAVFLKNIYISAKTKKPAYAISAPIKDDKTGQLLGVMVARFDLKNLIKMLEDKAGLGQTGEMFLINQDKYFLTPSVYLGEGVVLTKKIETENTKNCFDPQEVAALEKAYVRGETTNLHLGHEAASFFPDYRGVQVVGTHSYLPRMGWCLITKVDQSQFFAPLVDILKIISPIILFGIAVFILVGNLFARRITKPIEELQNGTKKIEEGDLNYKVGTSSNDEIGQLSRSFDDMVTSMVASRAEIDRKVTEQTALIIQKSKDMEDQQKAVLNILEDVEDEKNKVSQEKDKIDAILHSIGDGVFVVDQDLRIVLMNDVALGLCGCEAKNSLGQKYSDVLKFAYEDKPEQVNDSFIKNAISTGEVQEMSNHTVLMQPNGKFISVADSAAPLKDKDGKVVGCVVVFRDVTKERQVDKMKTEFISLASHQLRTPLSAIKWFTELLQGKDSGTLNAEQTEYAQNIALSTERMIELVNSLLNVSRIESGRIIIDPKPTDLGQLVKEVISELQNKINEKQLSLVVSVHQALPQISVDPKLIREVYANLLTNAVKYTPNKGEISVIISKKGEEIVSQITDSGMGIPKADQVKVFQKFYRGANAVKVEPNGNGLGIYLVKAIIESSRGKIWFQSEEGKGTTFWFSLPLSGTPAKKGEVTLDS